MAKVLQLKRSSPRVLQVLRMAKTIEQAPYIPKPAQKVHAELVGKAVFFTRDGKLVAGKAMQTQEDGIIVALAVPARDGLLHATDTMVKVAYSDVAPSKALVVAGKVACFEAGAAITLAEDQKAVAVKDGDKIIDYRDVTIDGHAATFATAEKRDRGGDYIRPAAFDKTLKDFMRNPVMLRNHVNTVESIAGSFSKASVDSKGLGVRGVLSNAPGLTDIRFKVAEGHIKAFSIGGIWHYGQDGYAIEEAELFEVSLVAIPMNPDALIATRTVGVVDAAKAFENFNRNKLALRED
jgi:HK97 family phage prohead protease